MSLTPGIDPNALTSVLEQWAQPPPEMIGHLERRNNKTGESVTLDYLDHAQTTRILTLCDPMWVYRFAAVADDGLPRIRQVDKTLYLGIELTLCGKTLPGIGSAQLSSPDPLKELIGDALRNAAMRFGIALNLWSKAETLPTDAPEAPSQGAPPMPGAKGTLPPAERHRERLRERANALPPGARGIFRASMDLQGLSFDMPHSGANDSKIERLIIAAELAEQDNAKRDAELESLMDSEPQS